MVNEDANRYYRILVNAAGVAVVDVQHWKRIRENYEKLNMFNDAVEQICQDNWWQSLDDDAVAGNLPEWTDE